jgi:hypothetical protein
VDRGTVWLCGGLVVQGGNAGLDVFGRELGECLIFLRSEDTKQTLLLGFLAGSVLANVALIDLGLEDIDQKVEAEFEFAVGGGRFLEEVFVAVGLDGSTGALGQVIELLRAQVIEVFNAEDAFAGGEAEFFADGGFDQGGAHGGVSFFLSVVPSYGLGTCAILSNFQTDHTFGGALNLDENVVSDGG